MNPHLTRPSDRPFAQILCGAALLLLMPHLVCAQKVASYDYTGAKPRERLRPPIPDAPPQPFVDRNGAPSLPPPWLVAGHITPGVCGGVMGGVSSFSVSLISLDRNAYAFGDEFSFVLKVEANRLTRIPIRASLAEVEPTDPSLSYEWHSMVTRMELRSPNRFNIWIGLLKLYGSKDIPSSEIELKPGEWVELRGKARMEWSNSTSEVVSRQDERYVIPLPLRDQQIFSANTWAIRGEGYRFDGEIKQESRMCLPVEQSGSGMPRSVTVAPKIAP
jgi:hypothetical protein